MNASIFNSYIINQIDITNLLCVQEPQPVIRKLFKFEVKSIIVKGKLWFNPTLLLASSGLYITVKCKLWLDP